MPLTVLHLALFSAMVAAAAAACPSSEWALHGDTCYWMSDFQLEWRSVASDCHLVHPSSQPVSVHNLDVHSFLADMTNGYSTWLGVHRASTTSGWTWSDGSPFNWEFWRSDQPYGDGEKCGFMNCDTHGEWCTADCTVGYYYFLCQVHA